ncbi:MAG: hypothetical protein H6707_07260 [Deltaproteobacteria bacterium]|nr:hypothetical protein [Deltaproteobacteria bacterium]
MSADDSKTTDRSSGNPANPTRERPSWIDQDPFAERGASHTERKQPASAATEQRAASGNVEVDEELLREAAASGSRDDAENDAATASYRSVTEQPGNKRVTSELRRPTRPRPRYDEDAREPPQASGRRWLGLPRWGWLVVALLAIAALLLILDIRNRDRFRLLCEAKRIELQRARRLLWPFGFEPAGNGFVGMQLDSTLDCGGTREFENQDEAESAYLEALIGGVRRQLPLAGNKQLKALRQRMQIVLRLTRIDPHRLRRKEVNLLLGEIAYRQGRAGLAQVEAELRSALSNLQEAQQRAAGRYEDLESWIDHLQNLLRSVAPSPGSTPNLLPGLPSAPLPTTSRPATSPGLPLPSGTPAAPPTRSTTPPPTTDGGPAQPDAGLPAAGSGILM